MKICILGAGTYGCYLANALAEKFPTASITLLDVGTEQIRSESEVGFKSINVKGRYQGATKGRYFGFGGTSAMWGGQLLFFGQHDFAPGAGTQEVVSLNAKWKKKVLGRFFPQPVALEDESLINTDLKVRKGIWLKFNQRNLFSYFGIDRKPNVSIVKNVFVQRLLVKDNRIGCAEVVIGEKKSRVYADIFYLTCGAFESLHILHRSGLEDMETATAGFGDHISTRAFKIYSKQTKLGKVDFRFRFVNGSMVTTRLIGEVEGLSFYCHPIYNESFRFFQFLKQLIFKRRFSWNEMALAVGQAVHLFPFVFQYLVQKQLYVLPPWYLHIDIEVDADEENRLSLVEGEDKFQQSTLGISFNIPQSTYLKLAKAVSKVKEFLDTSGVAYEEMSLSGSAVKLEDTYHPYNLYGGKPIVSLKNLSNPVDNLFTYHTGLLSRSGSINPTAALFCVIEDHVSKLDPTEFVGSLQQQESISSD